MFFVNKVLKNIAIENESNFSIEELLNEFEKRKKSIGLLFGQVQSGKTKYIIDIIDFAFSNKNFDLIFCLTSNNNMLTNQTFFRMWNNINIPVHREIKHHIGIINNKCAFVIGKNPIALKNMSDIIEYNDNKKILIIDDESDYGSININNKSSIKNESKINELINNSYDFLNNNGSGILQVTATPFSNLINTKNRNEVNFLYTLPLNDDYTGLDYFFNKPNLYLTIEKIMQLNCFVEIEDIDISNLDSEIKMCISILIISLMLYYQNQNDNMNHIFDLVIFNSLTKKDHTYIKNIILDEIENGDKLINYLINHKTIFFDFNNLLNLNINKNEFIVFIKNLIKTKQYKLIIMNSDLQTSFSELYVNQNSKFNILIGGTYISRGNTFDNLKTELMILDNDKIYIDTLLQRCRWFGYRKEVSKYMKIVLHSETLNALKLAKKLNDYFIKNKNGGILDISYIKNEINNFDNDKSHKNVRSSNDCKRN